MNYFQGPPKYQEGGPPLDAERIRIALSQSAPTVKAQQGLKASKPKNDNSFSGKAKKYLKNLEEDINTQLGFTMDLASDKSAPSENEEPIDNIRHTLGGMYTSNAIQNKFPQYAKYTGIPQAFGVLGSNVLGLSHEVMSLLKNERPWKEKAIESSEDMLNNFVGSLLSVMPFMSNEDKEDVIWKLSVNNLLPDGMYDGMNNQYLSKEQQANLKPSLYDDTKIIQGGMLPEAVITAKRNKQISKKEQGGNAYILNKNNKLMNRNYNFQDGGLLGSLAGKVSSTLNANTMGNTFGAFGGAGEKYKELLGGTGLEPKPLLDWATAEPQYRSKITKDLKWDRENQGWMDANGNSVSNDEITTKARELYDQDKQRNQTITEGLPMSTQFGALFALNQAEQDEMANKKSSLSDYPAVKSTYAPSGFEQGGQANDYNNLLSLFSDGGGTQQGGRVQQMMGYKEGSPYANEPYQTFNTDTITMNGVNRQILGIPNVGNPVLMQPNSGLYRFNNADYVTEIPMSRNGGMYIDGIEQAQFGKFLKGVGRTLHDFGRGKLDFIGNTTGLFDLSNEKYKTKFGKKFSGIADKIGRGVGTIGRAAANIVIPGSGTALGIVGKALNPNGLGNKGQQSMGSDAGQMGSSQQNPLAGLGSLLGGLGGSGGGGLGALLGGSGGGGLGALLGGSGGGGLGALLGGSGGGGLGSLLGFGEDGGKVQYNRLNSLFQDGGQTQPMPPQAQPQQEQMEAPQQESKLMQLPIEQQVELYKGLVDFVAQNGIDALEEQYPEEYEFFEAFSDFLEDSEDADGEEEDNQMPERMANGGIPQRYKNMGFSKVGQKKSSDRPGKKWMVLAKKGDKYKVVHGGAKGMSDFTKHRNEKRRQRFWDRMGGKDSAKAKDPFSPLYWARKGFSNAGSTW